MRGMRSQGTELNTDFGKLTASKEPSGLARLQTSSFDKKAEHDIPGLSEQAAELGAKAFAEGKKAVPAHDAALMELLTGLEVGGGASDIMKAWTDAWTKANLAAPVDASKKTAGDKPPKDMYGVTSLKEGASVIWNKEPLSEADANTLADELKAATIPSVDASSIEVVKLDPSLFVDHADIDNFIEYFWKFYGPEGLYPIEGLTEQQVRDAVETRKKNRPDAPFDGDTVDREMVRNVIMGKDPDGIMPQDDPLFTGASKEVKANRGWFSFTAGVPGYLYGIADDNTLYSVKEEDVETATEDAFPVTTNSFMSEEELTRFSEALKSEVGYDLVQSLGATASKEVKAEWAFNNTFRKGDISPEDLGVEGIQVGSKGDTVYTPKVALSEYDKGDEANLVIAIGHYWGGGHYYAKTLLESDNTEHGLNLYGGDDAPDSEIPAEEFAKLQEWIRTNESALVEALKAKREGNADTPTEASKKTATYYRLFDTQTQRYMATGYNAPSKEDLAEAYLSYIDPDIEEEDEAFYNGLDADGVLNEIGGNEFKIETSETPFDDQYEGIEASKKQAVYFDKYNLRVTIETKAGDTDLNYSGILNMLSAADIMYQEVKRYNLQPDRVIMDILVRNEDMEVVQELAKESKDLGIKITVNENIPEDILPRIITTPEKDLDEKLKVESSKKTVANDLVDDADLEYIADLVGEGNTSGQLAPGDNSGRQGFWTLITATDSPEELADDDLEHISQQIVSGMTSGELNDGSWYITIDMWSNDDDTTEASTETTAAEGVAPYLYDTLEELILGDKLDYETTKEKVSEIHEGMELSQEDYDEIKSTASKKTAADAVDDSAGFAISTSSEASIEDFATEKGLTTDDKFWADINDPNSGIPKLERNALNVLKSQYHIITRDEGHSDDDLIGSCWAEEGYEKEVLSTMQDAEEPNGQPIQLSNEVGMDEGVNENTLTAIDIYVSFFKVPETVAEEAAEIESQVDNFEV